MVIGVVEVEVDPGVDELVVEGVDVSVVTDVVGVVRIDVVSVDELVVVGIEVSVVIEVDGVVEVV